MNFGLESLVCNGLHSGRLSKSTHPDKDCPKMDKEKDPPMTTM